MIAIAAEHDYSSIGALAARLQQSVRAIEQAAQRLDVRPALRINSVPHYDGLAVEVLTDHFRTLKG